MVASHWSTLLILASYWQPLLILSLVKVVRRLLDSAVTETGENENALDYRSILIKLLENYGL